MSKICCTFAAGKGLGKKNGPIKGTFFRYHPMRRIIYILLTACTLTACTCGSSSASKGDAPVPDTIPYFANSLYYCNDSLLFYARRAYLEDDMDALCITGAAAYFHLDDTAALDTLSVVPLSVVPLDEAAIMLLHANPRRTAPIPTGCSSIL